MTAALGITSVILPALLAKCSASGLLGVPGLLRGFGFREVLLVSIEQP